MIQKTLVICDHEEVYADFLSKQLLRTYSKDLVIHNFNTPEQMIDYAKREQISYSLIAEEFQESLQHLLKGQYYWITTAREKEYENYIYRYQPAEKIYEKLFGQTGWEERKQRIQKEADKKIIGVYNPLHRSGQTSFAKALSDLYGSSGKNVLYLNLEEYAGINEYSEENLAKLLYYIKQEKKSIKLRLTGIVSSGEDHDYIKPIFVSEELKRITREEWMHVIQRIQVETGYEVLVLDLDSCIQGFWEILGECSQILVPVRESFERDKIEQFLQNLRMTQRTHLIDKIREVRIPEYGNVTNRECIASIKKMLEGVNLYDSHG